MVCLCAFNFRNLSLRGRAGGEIGHRAMGRRTVQRGRLGKDVEHVRLGCKDARTIAIWFVQEKEEEDIVTH